MIQNINRELLFLYWSGLATPMQQKLIVRWLEDASHREVFYQWLIEWEQLHPQALGDSDKAWGHLNRQLEAEAATPETISAPAEQSQQIPRFFTHWWMIAASILLIGGLSFLLREELFWNIYRTGNGEVKFVPLPDGSRATLNANSELRVPVLFLPYRERSLELTGEADFKVTHRPDEQRFVVETSSGVNVVVLGTEFVVRSRNRQFRVALHSGRITLEQPAKSYATPQFTLKPGDVASLNDGSHLRLVSHQPTRQLSAWQDHLFVFDRQTLPEVLAMLKEHFGVSVKLANDSLATHRITGRFRADRPEDLLEVIAEMTGYRIVTIDQQKYLTD